MTCANEDIQQLCEKIEPNLTEILTRFTQMLQQEYGLSEYAVVEIRLDKSDNFEKLLLNVNRRIICYDCGQPTRCYKIG